MIIFLNKLFLSFILTIVITKTTNNNLMKIILLIIIIYDVFTMSKNIEIRC